MLELDFNDYTPSSDLSTAETMPSRWYTEPAFLEHEENENLLENVATRRTGGHGGAGW